MSTLGGCGGPEKPDLKVSNLEGCESLQATGFFTVSTVGGCGGVERTPFLQFLFGRL